MSKLITVLIADDQQLVRAGFRLIIDDADDMLNALEKLNPGDSATLTLWRAGATRKVSVTLSESED